LLRSGGKPTLTSDKYFTELTEIYHAQNAELAVSPVGRAELSRLRDQLPVATLTKHGVAASDIEVVRVPGAFETPLAIKKLAASHRYQALIALGCVIRGATAHFDYVAGEASRGVSQVSLTEEIPVGFGILTVDSIEQAIERAGTKAGNKGIDAALAAIQMANVLRQLEQ